MPAEAIGGLAYGVTPLEQADGYATLANGGVHHDPTAISKVEFPDGKVDEIESEEGDRVLTPGQAYDVTNVLKGVITQRHRHRLHRPLLLLRSGRQDRHLGGRIRRLVRRLHAGILDRGLGRPPEVTRNDRLRRPDRGPDLAATTWKPRPAANAPPSKRPTSLPELSALTGGHTTRGGYHSSHFGEEERIRRRRTKAKKPKKKKARKKKPKKRPVEEAPEEVTHAPAGGGVSPG